MEIWRTVDGSNGDYAVSNCGRVKNTKTERILKPVIDQRGYGRVCLFTMNRDKRYKVHRLVAQAFIPNPNKLPQVNHKDGNKQNNAVENLEWITNEDNMKHANENGLREGHHLFCESKKKPIVATNVKTGEEIEYDSILAAGKSLGTRHIQEVLKGIRAQTKGYTFRLKRGDA